MEYVLIGLLLFIIGLILTIKSSKKIVKTNKINEKIEKETKILWENKKNIENQINNLIEKKEEKNEDLQKLENIVRNMNEVARKAYSEYCESLEQQYFKVEQDYDESIELLKQSYDTLQDNLAATLAQTKKELEKISQTRAAALEAQRKEQEIKNKKAFYCPQIAEIDLKDVKILRDIEYKLNNPRILRMLIWQTYYQKPMNQVCANVLGAATAEKTGIYKITNQKTDLVYIGQAVDIATRWKNHVKAGLGIDTPANNKLYRAMLEDGPESFSFEVLEECTRQQLDEKEKFYISLYQSDQFGYNSTSGNNK